jgi:hypothetical protein
VAEGRIGYLWSAFRRSDFPTGNIIWDPDFTLLFAPTVPDPATPPQDPQQFVAVSVSVTVVVVVVAAAAGIGIWYRRHQKLGAASKASKARLDMLQSQEMRQETASSVSRDSGSGWQRSAVDQRVSTLKNSM